jgi:RF-1 domain
MKQITEKGKVGFTLTRDDFKWEYFCAGGHGGQKQNKTASACRVTHPASKAAGISRDERSQPQNRKLAFSRMRHSKEFLNWCKVEMSRLTCVDKPKKPIIDLSINNDNTIVEMKDNEGNWVRII